MSFNSLSRSSDDGNNNVGIREKCAGKSIKIKFQEFSNFEKLIAHSF